MYNMSDMGTNIINVKMYIKEGIVYYLLQHSHTYSISSMFRPPNVFPSMSAILPLVKLLEIKEKYSIHLY
jgi:hypothetical protein